MMHVLESLVQSEEYSYLRMDGITSMSQRQETIRLFNKVYIYIYIYIDKRKIYFINILSLFVI